MFSASFLILLCAAASVYSQIPTSGSCPVVPAQSTMDLPKYLGLWYEIEAFPNSFERGNCTRAKYTMKPDGHIEVYNRGIENGQEFSVTGDAYVPDPNEPAKLLVQFALDTPYGNYWVIDTDYTEHSLIYSCEQVTPMVKLEFAWILARSMTLDATITQNLKNKLGSYNIDINQFAPAVQAGCPA